jgi:crotonobetainyl-CoA:carnitine CoA-transferase CaiB-like acyl-CoA transferase
VLDIAEMHRDPQTLAREMVVETEHPVAGPVKALGLPIKFSDTKGGINRPAPRLGEHNREVLAELGYGENEIERLSASGALASHLEKEKAL